MSAARRHNEHDPIDAALRDRIAVPDQTRAIMGRLGYMRVRADVARQQQRMALIRRAACMLLMAAAVGVGYTWYQSAGDIRRIDEVTLPGAFVGQMEQRSAAFTGLFESIRPLETDFSESIPAQSIEEPELNPQPIQSEPVEQGDSGDLPMIDVPQDDEAPTTVAFAPFRWT